MTVEFKRRRRRDANGAEDMIGRDPSPRDARRFSLAELMPEDGADDDLGDDATDDEPDAAADGA